MCLRAASHLRLDFTLPLHFWGFSSETAFVKFSVGSRLGGLSCLLRNVNLVGAARLMLCLGSLSGWSTHFKGISSPAWVNTTCSSILIYSDWYVWNWSWYRMWSIGLTAQCEKNPHVMKLAPPCLEVVWTRKQQSCKVSVSVLWLSVTCDGLCRSFLTKLSFTQVSSECCSAHRLP